MALDVVVRVLFALLALGVGGRITAVSLSALLAFGEGLSFSIGKIDHTILFVLAPLVFAWSGWDRHFSLAPRTDAPVAISRFLPRLFAFIIGTAFLTASIVKVRGGWLDPATQATYAYQLQQSIGIGKDQWLAAWLPTVQVPALWEAADWVTIIFEGALVLCALSWRAWRVGLAVTVAFHAWVLLSFNIVFWPNLIVYAAFVPWTRLYSRWRSLDARASITSAVLLAVFVSVVIAVSESAILGIEQSLVLIGGIWGVGYLVALPSLAIVRSRAARHGKQ